MPIVLKSGGLNLLEPSGPAHACNGIALPLPLLLTCDTWGSHSGTVKDKADVMLRCVDWLLATDVSKGLGQFDLPDEGTIIVPNFGHYLIVDWPSILDYLNIRFQALIFPGIQDGNVSITDACNIRSRSTEVFNP